MSKSDLSIGTLEEEVGRLSLLISSSGISSKQKTRLIGDIKKRNHGIQDLFLWNSISYDLAEKIKSHISQVYEICNALDRNGCPQTAIEETLCRLYYQQG